ncbi:replication protein, partial [uncultured marine virus]
MSVNPKSRNWCFTYFRLPGDPTHEHYWRNVVCKTFKYAVGQVEICPETGREHLQGYGETHAVTFDCIKSKLGLRVHVESRRGTREQAVAYCTKQESRADGYDPRYHPDEERFLAA